jgi:S-DNA-T family DNA segregation ATPase FtsK/SpoIIIE
MGLPGSRIVSATGNTWGFTARVFLRKGMTAVQAINQAPAIESGLGTKPGSVRALPDPARADAVIVRVIETDPHAQPIPWPGQPNWGCSKTGGRCVS